MSCGSPHETPCSEVLNHVYEYLDNEIDDPIQFARIKQHLQECRPCLEKYGLDQAVKALVHRSCGNDDVPTDLRDKVLARIRQVRVQADAPDTL